MEAFFLRTWQARGWAAWLLWPLSLLYRLLVALRRQAYKQGWLHSVALPVPVLVVGNIFIGGTGKTPLTIALVEALRAAGFNPGVVSRGYGGQSQLTALEVQVDTHPALAGDEPLLIATRCACPVFVGRQRVQVAQALLAAYPQVNLIISDDGLQHYALQRQCELMLFDQRGIGNGFLLPAGPLREPASRQADGVLVNLATGGADVPADWRKDLTTHPLRQRWPTLSGMVLHSELAYSLQHAQVQKRLDQFAGNGCAAAGIGNPERFFTMLRQWGLAFHALPLPDHFAFTSDPFVAIAADWILITEKDAVKCRQHAHLRNDPRIWVVPVSAQLDAALIQHIVEKCGGYPNS